MSDDAKRMFHEALDRLADAEILSQSMEARSDSSALLQILAFEVLLKCAIRLSGQTPKQHHDYQKLWLALPGYVAKEVLQVARARMPGHADLSDLPKLLRWYKFIFERARYHYELYEGWSLSDQEELGKLWVEEGAPIDKAVVQYYPMELYCLIDGLKKYIEGRLASGTS